MNSQKTDQAGAARGTQHTQGATGTVPGDGQNDEAAHGDHNVIAQAVRSVMHPELHEPEWRYFHGAVPG
jgi:hypothetical protein